MRKETRTRMKLSLTLDDLAQAKNPRKGSTARANKQESHDEPDDANDGGGSDSDNSENLDLVNPKKRKSKKRIRTRAKGRDSSSAATATGSGCPSADDRGLSRVGIKGTSGVCNAHERW